MSFGLPGCFDLNNAKSIIVCVLASKNVSA
uniref:Uncharacterized protein n=1 Tax=Arundo donax TaxID=35708 RepID=A0A0A9C701_ARUDO